MGLVNGIWQYDGTEEAAPPDDMLNLLGDSVRGRFSELVDLDPASVAPASSWGAPTVGDLPSTVIAAGLVHLLSGRIELKSGSVTFAAGADVAIGSLAPRAPATNVEAPCVLHFGNVIPVLGRVVISSTGTIVARSATTSTMNAGSSALVLVPPLFWLAA